MSGRLFKRSVRVTVTKPGLNAPFFGIGNVGAGIQGLTFGNTLEITDLRVQFKIEKTLKAEPNKCEIVITNLAATTRAQLQAKPMTVRIDAGYDGDERHLFTGDVRYAVSSTDGPDWNTTLQLGDGDRAYRYARVTRSYASGVDVRTVVKDAIGSLGLAVPNEVNASPDLARAFSTGYALNGAARDELTRLLQPYGYRWSIQDGRFQMLRDVDVRPDAPFLISQDTGMIGSPEFGPPDKKGSPPSLKVRNLLYPELTPGAQISLQARSTKGTFRMQAVRHNGDTHGEDFMTELEVTPR